MQLVKRALDTMGSGSNKRQMEEHTSKADEEKIEITANTISGWHHRHKIGASYIKVFAAPLDEVRKAVQTLDPSTLPPADGRNYVMPRKVAVSFAAACSKLKEGMDKFKAHAARNAKLLVPEVHQANEQLQAEALASHEAASEAASKLQATQVALHQSSAGHSNIGSAFPLSIEIAEKVKAFGSSDPHSALVLEHFLEKCDQMPLLASTMRALHDYCSATVQSAFVHRETTIMGALDGIERTPLIDGFMRRRVRLSLSPFLALARS